MCAGVVKKHTPFIDNNNDNMGTPILLLYIYILIIQLTINGLKKYYCQA